MEVELNNKKFRFTFEGNSYIRINLDNKFDILFFKEWSNQMYNQQTGESKPKVEYIRDVKFVGITQMGFFRSCFPVLDPDEDCVIIHFDYKHIL